MSIFITLHRFKIQKDRVKLSKKIFYHCFFFYIEKLIFYHCISKKWYFITNLANFSHESKIV